MKVRDLLGSQRHGRVASAGMSRAGLAGGGEDFVHESIIGSLFEGRAEAETTIIGRSAIRPSIAGWARLR